MTDQEESSSSLVTRRHLLMLISVAAGGVASAIVGLPLVGFLLAPLFRKQPGVWTFPLVTPRRSHSTIRPRWCGAAKIPRRQRGCGASISRTSRRSRLTAPISAVRCVGRLMQNSSCAPATAACTTKMGRSPPAPHRTRCSSFPCASSTTLCRWSGASFRLSRGMTAALNALRAKRSMHDVDPAQHLAHSR
jgi:hypothetical protein